jgi:hypothetical protein
MFLRFPVLKTGTGSFPILTNTLDVRHDEVVFVLRLNGHQVHAVRVAEIHRLHPRALRWRDINLRKVLQTHNLPSDPQTDISSRWDQCPELPGSSCLQLEKKFIILN